MTIQHSLIPDGQIHEPKGSSTAATGSVYISNGAGSGTWKRMDSLSLKGMNGDGGTAGKYVVSDGLGGFQFQPIFTYGSMGFSNNSNAPSWSASVWQQCTGVGFPIIGGITKGITYASSGLTASQGGVFLAAISSVVKVPATASSLLLQFQLAINGTRQNATIKCGDQPTGSAGIVTVSGTGFLQLSPGDVVTIWANNSSPGTSATITDLTLTLNQVG